MLLVIVVFTSVVMVALVVAVLYRFFSAQQIHITRPVKGDDLPIWPFAPTALQTPSEIILFQRLQQALPEYHIFTQVQLSRVIAPTDESDKSFWFNRICRMSLDYLVVDTDHKTPLVAIELDDWTHNNSQRKKADAKKDKALASAGIPLLRYHCEQPPAVTQLRQDLTDIMTQYPIEL